MREEKKKKGSSKQYEDPMDPGPRGASPKGTGITPKLEISSSFSPTQILSVASVVLSQAGLYSKRKELKVLCALAKGLALVNKPKTHAQPSRSQIPVRVKPMD